MSVLAFSLLQIYQSEMPDPSHKLGQNPIGLCLWNIDYITQIFQCPILKQMNYKGKKTPNLCLEHAHDNAQVIWKLEYS